MTGNDELSYWVVLHAVPGMGPVTFRRLVDRFGLARTVIEEADRAALADVRGVTRALAEEILRGRSRIESARRAADELQQKGVRILRVTDRAYPAALHDLANAPPLLYVFGEVGPQDARSISMVGTTKPSQRGRAIAEEFAKRFAGAGVTVVSGYAHGVDAAAHRGAFKGGGRSILCVPYGIRHFKSRPDFPPLSEIARRGALVSERPPDEEWNSQAAVSRNRIIAALGRAIFVVETRPKGGTMHTAKAAQELGRTIFAVKYQNPPDSARGNSILIARGATAVAKLGEVESVLERLGVLGAPLEDGDDNSGDDATDRT